MIERKKESETKKGNKVNFDIVKKYINRINFCLSSNKKILIITSGVSGSGKTSTLFEILKHFIQDLPFFISSEGIINLHELTLDFKNEENKFYKSSLDCIFTMMKVDEKIIAFDHLNLDNNKLKKLYILADKYKYSVITIKDSDLRPNWNWNSEEHIRKMIIQNSRFPISKHIIDIQISKRFQIC